MSKEKNKQEEQKDMNTNKMEEQEVTKDNSSEGNEVSTAEKEQQSEEKHEDKKDNKKSKKDKDADKIAALEKQIEQMNDKYLRLSAEFDNYRRRTLKEKMELTKTAGESILTNILPVIDDFERAIGSMEQGLDENAVKDGLLLIYSKFKDFLNQNGIKEIEANGTEFDTDLHEALTKIPAPSEELKGKVVDVIQKGYVLNEKVIRFAKVVVGE
ncbi:nucleotide exchange factor GrpE [Prolixibacter sp. SD074]|jgi:molecular chaperone GrpE|uniref:nucleotide exchange factor GrpE n=1 Tax=Prolixibacter sp. SD074 TaxID=2652391 RepID=UPI001270C27E|nr:nucleotide exchange factor GrpE [Prolixibacter sp. SD074]GET31049.1 protein GrpE [Prolixibacter sp. SD074]